METGSYLELALTLYGWQVSNRIAELLVASGLIYIPFAVAGHAQLDTASTLPGSESRRSGFDAKDGTGHAYCIHFDHPMLYPSGFGQDIRSHAHQPNYRKGNFVQLAGCAIRERRNSR